MDAFTKEINQAYFNAVIFEALMRGIHLAVFISALSTIWTSPKRGGQSRLAMTILITVLFILATADLGSFWAYVRRAFIAHGDTAESIAAALNEYPTWFTAMLTFSDANAVLADCVIIWRAWVIWGRNWKITVIPIICTVLTFTFSIIAIYQTVTNTTFGVLGVDYATALYSTTLVTTIFCTIAIVYRVISIGGFRSYRSIVEILVQSSLLYCIATLFALIAYIVDGPASEYASAFWTACTGIAPTLVVARVAGGQASPKQTWPWDVAPNANEVHSNYGPHISLPRFSRSTREMSNGQTLVTSETVTRTYYDHDISGDSGKKKMLSGEVYKPTEVV